MLLKVIKISFFTIFIFLILSFKNPVFAQENHFVNLVPDQQQKIDQEQDFYLQTKNKLPFATPIFVFFLAAVIFLVLILIGFRLSPWLLPVLILGVLSQGVTMFKSGLLYSFGMGFWGANGHDGIWHLALINELTRHWPPQNMVFAQFSLANYHWFFDGLIALVHKITFLPIINLYFQIFPLIISGLLGILSFLLIKKISKNCLSGILAAFFVYFGGSFGWLFTLVKGEGLGGESMFWANQSISFLINPPFAISLVLILLGFYLFLNYQRKPTIRLLVILTLIFGLLIGFKAYAGVVILAGLEAAAFWHWLIKHNRSVFWLFLTSLLLSLLVFLPTNRGANSLFVFSPLWFVHTMVAFSDRLGWIRLDQARQAYFAGNLWLKLFLAEGLALLIFFIGNLGSRILALGEIFSWFRQPKKASSFQIFLLTSLLVSALIPLLFIQKGNSWNTIQFFYYFLFLSGLLAALWLGRLLAKKKVWMKILVLFLLIVFTIPTTLGTLKHYLPYRAPARVGFEELEALSFLSRQAQGIVLAYPHDYSLRAENEAPKPLFVYETTAYVSALSDKIVFLEDEMNLEIMQVDWRFRRQESENFFKTNDLQWAKEFLNKNKIKYLYLLDGQALVLNSEKLELREIFDNGLVKIFQKSIIILNKDEN